MHHPHYDSFQGLGVYIIPGRKEYQADLPMFLGSIEQVILWNVMDMGCWSVVSFEDLHQDDWLC